MARSVVRDADGTRPRWIEYVPVADVVPADANPKAHDADLLDRSVRRFGFVEPPQLDERTGKLVAGHGRVEALQRAEALTEPPKDDDGKPITPWPPPGVSVGDDGRWLLPVVRGWSSVNDIEARAYVVVANRSPERGGWQARPLAEYLHDLDQAAAGVLDDIGYDRDEYDQLLQSTGLKGELEGDFLRDLADGSSGSAPGQTARQGATDVVDLRLPMKDRDRDEAVALLRKHQRALSDAGRPSGTLSETALEVLRSWSV